MVYDEDTDASTPVASPLSHAPCPFPSARLQPAAPHLFGVWGPLPLVHPALPAQKWRPRWGYGKKDAVAERGFIELPDQADPYMDAFAKLKEDKEKRMAKNKNQNLRNTAAARLYSTLGSVMICLPEWS